MHAVLARRIALATLSVLVLARFSASSADAASTNSENARVWHAGQTSFSFNAPAITAELGWTTSRIHGLVWYPVATNVSEVQQYISRNGAALFQAGSVAVGARLSDSRRSYPLILLSHGNGGSAAQMAWLGTVLARAGFVVAAINQPGNTSSGPATVQGFTEWWFRPPALSMALSAVLADSRFGPHIDRTRIGAAGFSRGGYSVVALAGGRVDLPPFRAFCAENPTDGTCAAPPEIPDINARVKAMTADDSSYRAGLAAADGSYADPRIRAIYAMAPSVGESVTVASMRSIAIPARFVYGSADLTVPPRYNALRFAEFIRGATVLVIPHASHFIFFDACTSTGKVNAARLCTDAPSVDRIAVHAQIARDAVRFFEKTLKL